MAGVAGTASCLRDSVVFFPMATDLTIELLADNPEQVPVLAGWFEAEWGFYYGKGGRGDARTDLDAYSGRDALPVAVVAIERGELRGIAALKATSIASHGHLSPWAAAGLVQPEHRGRGIGSALVGAVEGLARRFGYARLYCGTSTAGTLLERRRWTLMERIVHEGKPLSIYEKALGA